MINTLNRMFRTGILTEPAPPNQQPTTNNQQQALWQILGRALCIRHVDAGSCNACELEIHALNNPYYNLEGIGIKFVASPRHADLLLVTGPVSVNMEEALRRTYDAIPDPKLVVAIGDCATCGGIFISDAYLRGARPNLRGHPRQPHHPRLPAHPASNPDRPPRSPHRGNHKYQLRIKRINTDQDIGLVFTPSYPINPRSALNRSNQCRSVLGLTTPSHATSPALAPEPQTPPPTHSPGRLCRESARSPHSSPLPCRPESK